MRVTSLRSVAGRRYRQLPVGDAAVRWAAGARVRVPSGRAGRSSPAAPPWAQHAQARAPRL